MTEQPQEQEYVPPEPMVWSPSATGAAPAVAVEPAPATDDMQVPDDFSAAEITHDGFGTLDSPPPGVTITAPLTLIALVGDNDPDDPPQPRAGEDTAIHLPAVAPDRQIWLSEIQALVASAATYEDFKTAVAALTAENTP